MLIIKNWDAVGFENNFGCPHVWFNSCSQDERLFMHQYSLYRVISEHLIYYVLGQHSVTD